MPAVLFANEMKWASSALLAEEYRRQGVAVFEREMPPGVLPDLVLLRTWSGMSPELFWAALGVAAGYGALGVRVANPVHAHLLMMDKRWSARCLEQAGLPQPRPLQPQQVGPGCPAVIKPALGAKGRGVTLLGSAEQARACLSLSAEPVVLQEYLEGETVRAVVADGQCLGAYRKLLPEGSQGIAANIAQGAASQWLDPLPPRLAELAVAATAAVGGITAGVDLLLSPQRGPVVLELNTSYRVPAEFPQLLAPLCQALLG